MNLVMIYNRLEIPEYGYELKLSTTILFSVFVVLLYNHI